MKRKNPRDDQELIDFLRGVARGTTPFPYALGSPGPHADKMHRKIARKALDVYLHNPRRVKVLLGDTDLEILGLLSIDSGKSTTELEDETGLSSSSISSHVTKLRGLRLIERHRDEDEGLLIYLTSKGEKVLNQRKSEENPNSQEVRKMAVSVKISDDVCEELDTLMEEEEISSYAEAVDYALADYFGLLEEEEETEEEVETR